VDEPYGRVALILSESLFHLLVEEGVITKALALEAIEGAAELTREAADPANPDAARGLATELLKAIAASFALKD
jgi:hypothetical protein